MLSYKSKVKAMSQKCDHGQDQHFFIITTQHKIKKDTLRNQENQELGGWKIEVLLETTCGTSSEKECFISVE